MQSQIPRLFWDVFHSLYQKAGMYRGFIAVLHIIALESSMCHTGSVPSRFEYLGWWATLGLNQRPHPYQGCALPTELVARLVSNRCGARDNEVGRNS